MKIWPNSPVHMPKYEGILPFPAGTGASSPIAINNVTSTNPTNNLKLMEQNIMVSPQHVDMDEFITTISKDSSPIQVSQWLTYHRLNAYLNTFAQFSGSDILRMSKEDLIQVCGLADGIRMFNTLHSKRITPRLTIYVSLDGSNYNAIYLISNTVKELTQKLFKLPGFFEMISNNSSSVESSNGYPGWGMISKYSGSGSNIYNDTSKLFIFTTGPSGIHVMITDEVLNNAIKDESLFTLEAQNGKILMKNIIKSDNTI
ncbi:transcription factor CP2 isoform X2 [Condylostylus longicornis]|uniref:transcription factor CP2 isoform X2 n=2 Tax=Condylostylus longicornis TaxID=2530218 RepID=UPI00244E0CCA|nr:transcription factor CP2 isoform X2 [Condylostylus longicornis]